MTTPQETPEFVWAAEMPLLTNRFFLYDAVKLLFWVAVVFSAILLVCATFAESLGKILPVFGILGLILAGFLFLFVLIAWIFFGNRFATSFRVSSYGIGWASLSRRARTANRLAVVAGALGGSMSTAGAGLLAVSAESGAVPWSDIRQVKKYPDERVITIMNSWRVVIRLYCTPENYAYVSQLLDWYFNATRPAAALPTV